MLLVVVLVEIKVFGINIFTILELLLLLILVLLDGLRVVQTVLELLLKL